MIVIILILSNILSNIIFPPRTILVWATAVVDVSKVADKTMAVEVIMMCNKKPKSRRALGKPNCVSIQVLKKHTLNPEITILY